MIEVLGVKNADKLVPTEDDATPADPVSENMDALIGKPMKAFIYQDHEAHIATHTSFMQDPMIAQTIGQNPQAQQIMASLQAHIAEHLGFNYRKQIEEKLGVPLPAPNEEMPENIEVNLARLVADAGKQLTQAHQQEAAQKQAQQQQQDPVVQMQQAELQLKGQEVQRKTQKDQTDAQLKAAELERKSKKDEAEVAIGMEQLKLDREELVIDAKKSGVKMAAERRRDNAKSELDLVKAATENKRDK
tara:strand:- start:38 stop:775 length:738 start_codon:yes stop_codon:yes gene_type:complete